LYLLPARRPFLRSRPSKRLLLATLLVVAATVLLPYMPLAGLLGFAPLPGVFLIAMFAIVALYILAAEITKAVFYRWA
jgi:P-type Mg2+ transporter